MLIVCMTRDYAQKMREWKGWSLGSFCFLLFLMCGILPCYRSFLMAELICIVNNNNRKLKRIVTIYKMESLFTTLKTQLINITFNTKITTEIYFEKTSVCIQLNINVTRFKILLRSTYQVTEKEYKGNLKVARYQIRT